ncbi:MAG: response regulator [bacterium]|nr:response regulator [bacterium]
MIKNVLLIDDDDVTLMICRLRLKKSNFCENVFTALNGEEAVQFLEDQLLLPLDKQHLPDLIFLDLNMPVMDGWTFMDIYESRFKILMPTHAKIDILSSTVDPMDHERAKLYDSVRGFISKPLTEINLSELKGIETSKKT